MNYTDVMQMLTHIFDHMVYHEFNDMVAALCAHYSISAQEAKQWVMTWRTMRNANNLSYWHR